LKSAATWLKDNRYVVLVFLVLLIHGSLIGLSDDEAYYWVLAQTPALGYAFHPPAVAWFIAFFQFLLGSLLGIHHPGLVRLPAALSIALILGMSLAWLEKVTLLLKTKTMKGFHPFYVERAVAALLSFFGFFALSWMMVPDIPLFLGWTLLFTSTWSICFAKTRRWEFWLLGLATVLTLLSKYSGVLAVGSAFISLCIWAPQKKRNRGIVALVVGGALAAFPILVWNAQHEWGSILYQIRDRHAGSSLSWVRYLRFWLIELVIAGPAILFYSFWIVIQSVMRKFRARPKMGRAGPSIDIQLVWQFVAIWILPAAAVFCVQPLFSDFKPHWAFIVWWPATLVLALAAQTRSWKWIRYQCGYGAILGILILLSCHFPIGSWLGRSLSGASFDPRLDVTNDLYGWRVLNSYLQTHIDAESRGLPVVGSRYQTASQASFSLDRIAGATQLPRDLKERDEWPNLHVSETQGPGWPHLKSSVLFVTDNRYDAPPDFPTAKCRKLGRASEMRFGILAKWIDVWRCDP
jgi:hypothetical protein